MSDSRLETCRKIIEKQFPNNFAEQFRTRFFFFKNNRVELNEKHFLKTSKEMKVQRNQ